MNRIMAALLAVSIAVLLSFGLPAGPPAASPAREHIIAHGPAETGALNLVTAIYLGYRAVDTLGETLVLLLAVTGVAMLIGDKP